MKYSTKNDGRARFIFIMLLAAIIAAGIGWILGSSVNCAQAENRMATCWAMCKPGTQINVRRQPNSRSAVEGYLEAGDEILTDGSSKDGWIRVYGIGENGGGWVYSGYVSTEKPKQVFQQYVCVATKRVACRRWIGGPQVEGRSWLKNGENVDVFLTGDGWAVTSRGYIKTEWLEVDPK